MKNCKIYDIWTQFIKEFPQCSMTREEIWFDTLKIIDEYINKNKKIPLSTSTDIYTKYLGNWLITQRTSYKKKKYLMKNKKIYIIWESFIKIHYKYFKTCEEKWFDMLEQLKIYIEKENKKPSLSSKNISEKQLGRWMTEQITYYKKVKYSMKNKHLYDAWTQFIKDYSRYFKTNETKWFEIFMRLKIYIDEKKKKPMSTNNDVHSKQLGRWIEHQQSNHRRRTQIMKNKKIYNIWTQFIKDYCEYF